MSTTQDRQFSAKMRCWDDSHERDTASTECHRCGEIIVVETNFWGDCEFDSDEDGHLCDSCYSDWEDYQRGKADEATREFYDGEF